MKNIILPIICISLLFSCKSTEKKEEQPVSTEINTSAPIVSMDNPAIDSLEFGEPQVSDSLMKALSEKSLKEQSPDKPATVKICAPNFTELSAPQKNIHFYYISGFKPDEFKCWNEIENHGVKICGGNPCTIYYLDNASVKVQQGSKPIDATTLQTNGLGLFVHNGKYWEMKGGSVWKRKGAPYAYYNTDNHLGG